MRGVRPRLRHDVLFADAGNGVLLRSPDGGLVVRGRSAYRLTSALVPFLTGKSTVAELCGSLPDAQQTMVAELVQTLLDRGFARDMRPQEPQDLADPVRENFRPQLNYIEHYVDDADARFVRFRESRVLILGTGPMAQATGLSLVRNGMRVVELASAAGGGDEPAVALSLAAELVAEAENLTAADCPALVQVVPSPGAGLGALDLSAYAMVVAPVEDLSTGDVLRLNVRYAAAGPVLLPATVVGGHAVLGPLVRPGVAPCWICAMLRLGATATPGAVAALWREASLPELRGHGAPSPPLSAMIGNMLGYDVFRLLTGCMPAETSGAVLVQDLDTIEVAREDLMAHPSCPRCRDHTGAAPATEPVDLPAVLAETTEAPAPSSPGSSSPGSEAGHGSQNGADPGARYAALFGTYTGVLRTGDDMSIDQSPLKVGRVAVGPAGPADTGTTRMITAFDVHTVLAARARAVRAALGVYIGRLGYAPNAVTPPGADPPDLAVPLADLMTWTGSSWLPPGPQRWTRATSLVSGQPRLVPTAAVYPYTGDNSGPICELTSAGNGVGASMPDAVRAGVLSALAYEALRDSAGDHGATTTGVALGTPETGSAVEFLLRTAKNLDTEVDLVELAGDAPAHLILARARGGDTDPPLWAVGAAFAAEPALVEALRDLLGQVALRRQPGTGAADLGDPLLPDLDVRAIPGPGREPAAPKPSADLPAVVAELRRQGRDALVVPTTTPDLREAGGMVTVRILLTRLDRR